ncbi:hypothetical protein ACP4OV_014161 [Aristida adscensionis]
MKLAVILVNSQQNKIKDGPKHNSDDSETITPMDIIDSEALQDNMTIILEHYVESLISKHPYWNRTLGVDHFFVTCHDVGVREFEELPFILKNSIRVVYVH